jgi:hypothetical protein
MKRMLAIGVLGFGLPEQERELGFSGRTKRAFHKSVCGAITPTTLEKRSNIILETRRVCPPSSRCVGVVSGRSTPLAESCRSSACFRSSVPRAPSGDFYCSERNREA